MARQKSKKGKGSYAIYKSENKVLANKIKKLVRHCKKFPNDATARENLERIKKNGYKCRAKPLIPGSNPTIAKIRLGPISEPQKTAGEQLSELLGIPLPKPKIYKRKKPKVTHKQRRNVKT